MYNEPQTLVEAIRHFADPDVTLKTMAELRWPTGVHCPTCGRTDVRFIATRRMWECKENHPRKQFSAKVGTIFEDSPLSLDKWFVVIWMTANCKNGVSSYEVHRGIWVTQKTAWFMLHRIRLAMQTGSFIRSAGEFEADETFIGGKARNMSKARREKTIKGTGGGGKEVVMGVLRRGADGERSKVVAQHVPNNKKGTVQAAVRAVAAPGSTVHTDALKSYAKLSPDYVHQFVDHAVEFVRDAVHTNGLENFWSLFKRALKGTYVALIVFRGGEARTGKLDSEHLVREQKRDLCAHWRPLIRFAVQTRLTMMPRVASSSSTICMSKSGTTLPETVIHAKSHPISFPHGG